MPLVATIALAVNRAVMYTSSVLAGVVTEEMMNGVFDEVVGVLPIAMPVMVQFIALRKGISFVSGILHSA